MDVDLTEAQQEWLSARADRLGLDLNVILQDVITTGMPASVSTLRART